MSSTVAILNKSASQLENERSILKAIIVQGAAPVFCALPIGMVLIGVFFFDWKSVNWVVLNASEDMVLTTTDICWIFFVITPSIDALVVLVVVKQYRKACADILKRLPFRFCQGLATNEPSTNLKKTFRANNKARNSRVTARVAPARTFNQLAE